MRRCSRGATAAAALLSHCRNSNVRRHPRRTAGPRAKDDARASQQRDNRAAWWRRPRATNHARVMPRSADAGRWASRRAKPSAEAKCARRRTARRREAWQTETSAHHPPRSRPHGRPCESHALVPDAPPTPRHGHGQSSSTGRRRGGHVALEPENMFDGVSHVRRRTLPSAEACLLAVTPDDIYKYSDFFADAALRFEERKSKWDRRCDRIMRRRKC